MQVFPAPTGMAPLISEGASFAAAAAVTLQVRLLVGTIWKIPSAMPMKKEYMLSPVNPPVSGTLPTSRLLPIPMALSLI